MSSLNKFKDKKTGISYDFEDSVARQSIEELQAQVGGGLAVTGASVGQTIKIAAVDENGAPTAWEAVDFPNEGEFELIEQITVEEEGIKNIKCNSFPDGNRYSFKKMFAMLTFPLFESSFVTGNLECTISSGSTRVYSIYGSSITLDTNQYGRKFKITVFAEIVGGVLVGEGNMGIEIQLEHARRVVGPVSCYMGTKTLTAISVGVANGIPVGSVFELYGVRA